MRLAKSAGLYCLQYTMANMEETKDDKIARLERELVAANARIAAADARADAAEENAAKNLRIIQEVESREQRVIRASAGAIESARKGSLAGIEQAKDLVEDAWKILEPRSVTVECPYTSRFDTILSNVSRSAQNAQAELLQFACRYGIATQLEGAGSDGGGKSCGRVADDPSPPEAGVTIASDTLRRTVLAGRLRLTLHNMGKN
jgi:hypothetical protein